jgi:hypothetical protein
MNGTWVHDTFVSPRAEIYVNFSIDVLYVGYIRKTLTARQAQTPENAHSTPILFPSPPKNPSPNSNAMRPIQSAHPFPNPTPNTSKA